MKKILIFILIASVVFAQDKEEQKESLPPKEPLQYAKQFPYLPQKLSKHPVDARAVYMAFVNKVYQFEETFKYKTDINLCFLHENPFPPHITNFKSKQTVHIKIINNVKKDDQCDGYYVPQDTSWRQYQSEDYMREIHLVKMGTKYIIFCEEKECIDKGGTFGLYVNDDSKFRFALGNIEKPNLKLDEYLTKLAKIQ